MFDLAHIHVMIVHLPLIGVALAMIPLIWWTYAKDKTIQLVGLVIMGISLIGLPVAMGSGEETLEKFMSGNIAPDLDSAGSHYALLHYEAAEMVSKIGYVALIVIAGQVFFWNKKFKYKKELFLVTVLLNLILIIGFSYVGYLGWQIRHPEFRPVTTQWVTVPALAE
jgi:uncharacterized membrane protein